MKTRSSFIAIALAILMLLGTLTACNGGGTETDTPPSLSTERENGTAESATDTEAADEGNAEGSGSPDTTPLALTAVEDLFPDLKEYEKVASRENFKPTTTEVFEEKIEAENYNTTTISELGTLSSKEYSGRVMAKIITTGEPAQGWDYVYSISYTVTVPRKGYYQITALTSTLNQAFTSDFSLDVNGVRRVVATDTAKVLEDIDYSFDKDLMFLYDLGTLALEAGKNTFTFVLDNEDSAKSKNRLSFCMDYFTVTEANGNVNIAPEITIGADISALEDSDVLKGAAEVNVFDRRLPLKLSFAYYFAEKGDANYTVTDYFGDVVYEGTFSGEQYDIVKMERLIKNHPTGYFTFSCGRETMSYVVTPAYDTRTLTDSPFAMDLAAYYHIKTLASCYNVTAAARLAGVTWVRDRARWSDYEATQGIYDFSATEKLFKTIDSTGMNLLVNLCGAPKWATESLGYTGTWTVAGFRDTQLAFYNMCREMAKYYDGVVDAWELWNESDHASSYESAEHFTAWYKAGAIAISESSPNTTVIFGGFCQPNNLLDYDHLAMLNDILKFSNVFNYHSHIIQAKEFEYVSFTSMFMSDVTHASISLYNGETSRPTWVTEAGMRIDYMVDSSYEKQANYLITSAVESLSIGTDKHFWFVIAPYMEGGGDFGTFSSSMEPYPALAAEAIMTKVLGKAEYVGIPAGLSKNAYGYTFYTGERYASVLWSMRTGDKYVIETDHPVLVTDMMGNETLYEPEDGKITVRMSINPIYVTYTVAPDHLPHTIPHEEIIPLTFTTGEKVILSPEFENYDVNDKTARTEGYLIRDGLKINVRVINLNSVEVKGTVSASLTGFEILGGDKEITLAPYSEGFVTLTLKKTGDREVNSYVTFTGTFNGEKTSNASAHVRTEGGQNAGVVTVDVADGRALSLEKDLRNITATVTDATGTPLILLNDSVFEKYTYQDGRFTIDLYGMEEGKYTLIVAVETDGGDYIFQNLFFTVEGEKYLFTLP